MNRNFTAKFFTIFGLGLWLANLSMLVKTPGGSWLSITLLILSTLVTFFRPKSSPYIILALLPLTPSFANQMDLLFKIQLPLVAHPGIDLILGMAVGLLLRHQSIQGPVMSETKFYHNRTKFLLLALMVWINISAVTATARNFYSGALHFSANGFLFNFFQIRSLSFFDTYYPFQEVFYANIAVICIFAVFKFLSSQPESQNPITSAVTALGVSHIFVGTYGVYQFFSQAGYFRDAAVRGINSFFRDIHSFAGFELLIFTMSLLWIFESRGKIRIFFFFNLILSMACLYLTKSKATILLIPAVLTLVSCYLVSRHGWLNSKVKISGIFAIVGSISCVMLVKAVQFQSGISSRLFGFVNDMSFASLNELSTKRLEIYDAALTMIRDFPIQGLGIGMFYRISSIANYSKSPELVSVGGENAHNYFLQVAAETGLVGLILLIFLVYMPGSKLKLLRSTVLLIAVGLSNVFAHSLLEKDFLALAAVLVGIHLHQIQDLTPNPTAFLFKHIPLVLWRKFAKYTAVFGVGILFAVDLAHNFSKYPFIYGQMCYEKKSKYHDSWLTGEFYASIPQNSSRATLVFEAARPRIGKQPMTLTITATSGINSIVKPIFIRDNQEISFELDLPESQFNEEGVLNVKTSSCFNPKTSGLNADSRFLGISLKKMDFH